MRILKRIGLKVSTKQHTTDDELFSDIKAGEKYRIRIDDINRRDDHFAIKVSSVYIFQVADAQRNIIMLVCVLNLLRSYRFHPI